MEPVYWLPYTFTPPLFLFLIQTLLPSQARFSSLNMAAFQMQLNEFVTPAYFGVNSLFFHSFANSNLVGRCILALLKHHEYTDGPVRHSKPEHCRCILVFFFFFTSLRKRLK